MRERDVLSWFLSLSKGGQKGEVIRIIWACVGPCISVIMCDNAGVEEHRDIECDKK